MALSTTTAETRSQGVVWMNGGIVAYDEATVHIDSVAFRYAAMVFEGIRAYTGRDARQSYVVLLRDHVERLRQSMRVMRFSEECDVEALEQAVVETARAAGAGCDLHIRLMAWVDGVGSSTTAGPVGYAVSATSRGRTYDPVAGLRACVSSWWRTADNAIPARVKCAANYQNARLSLMQANVDGYDLAILLDGQGHVTESPTSCVFMVKRGELVTTPVYGDILESITRAAVLELAAKRDQQVVERPIDRTELYTADEIFVCGSGAELAPVVDIDGYPVGDGTRGALTEALQQAYFEAVRGETAALMHWLTPVQ